MSGSSNHWVAKRVQGVAHWSDLQHTSVSSGEGLTSQADVVVFIVLHTNENWWFGLIGWDFGALVLVDGKWEITP